MSRGIVQGTWGPRATTPAELASATRRLVCDLEPFLTFVDAPFGINEGTSINDDLSQLEAAFEAGRFIDDAGLPQPQRGYRRSLFGSNGQRCLSLIIDGGTTIPMGRVAFNKVILRVEGEFPADAYRAFAESNLLAIVDAFEPAFGWAAERVHLKVNPVSSVIPGIGPLTYLADAFAVPPRVRGTKRARHGNGTLLRLKPRWGENVWTDPAPTQRVINALAKRGWAPSLADRPPSPAAATPGT